MANSIGLWAVMDGRLQRVMPSTVDRERRLEDWIESHPDILGERLLIVDRQVRTPYGGIIDLLALDSEGRCVVIELKRGRTPRDVVAQALDYVSWVAELTDAELRDRIARTAGTSFVEAYQFRFGPAKPPEQLNTDQRMMVVSTDVDEATARIVQHLTRRYGVDMNVVALTYFVVDGKDVLARTWVVDPVELEDRVDSRVSDPAVDAERTWTGLWHVNVGIHADESIGRNWDDERRYGFLSAGQGPRWRDEMLRLRIGDPVYAYLNGAGYVGGGIVTSTAVRANDFVPIDFNTPLRDLPVETQGWFTNGDDSDLAEYMVGVRWSRTVDPSQGVRVSPAIRGSVRKIWSSDLAQTLRATLG